MTRELKFTTSSLQYTDPQQDCYLDPNDPIYDIMGVAQAGRVQAAAEPYWALRNQAQQQGVRPGTPAWFALTQPK